MASTSMNQFSSRSHAIIQLSLTLPQPITSSSHPPSLLLPKLSLVDLAGSERAAATENRGLRMTEGAKINKSLLALGNCINILSDPNKQGAFVPYR
jgi:kinesin family protein 18/19